MPDFSTSTPLLLPSYDEDDDSYSRQRSSSPEGFPYYVRRLRRDSQQLLASRAKHFVVMGIVALDFIALLSNVFIQLIACETHQNDVAWVERVTEGLEIAGLNFQQSFHPRAGDIYLTSWFHIFDSVIIVASFVIDIFSKGLAESIGSLIVVLRLWRLAKISEEVVMGAAERTELLEEQLEELKTENSSLRARLGIRDEV
ncbi:hypothetical protein PT974_11569 [Cladobotryum mycophilum]|uniref:Hydrogen voltage-gated channel 1 n=1 Tax=Cladobotryum mycophilum TaxID=491253 RepID=A0ABR0S5K5_9HYPO